MEECGSLRQRGGKSENKLNLLFRVCGWGRAGGAVRRKERQRAIIAGVTLPPSIVKLSPAQPADEINRLALPRLQVRRAGRFPESLNASFGAGERQAGSAGRRAAQGATQHHPTPYPRGDRQVRHGPPAAVRLRSRWGGRVFPSASPS